MRIKSAFLLVLFLLTSCALGGTPTSEPTSAVEPTPTTAPVPTVNLAPTPSAPLVILVLPADMNPERSKEYQTAVYDLAQAAGFRFQILNKFSAADLALESNLKVVIALPPDPGIASLAAAAPQAQFLAVNIPGITPGGNVSVLGGEGIRIDQIAFMAGYIGAMITEDYRTGVLLRKDSPDAVAISTALRAGQEFYCGLCRGYVGPWDIFPLEQAIPEDAKPAEYGAYADVLLRQKVETIFIQPGVDIPELLQYLPTVGILMIGTKTPSKDLGGWVVTLQPNYLEALKAAWPELSAGQGGKAFPAPLSFTDVNPDLFSPGKQLLAQKTMNDLLSGLISNNTNP